MACIYNGENFYEREFVILFTYILSLNGVQTIQQYELGKKLYPYKFDEKYKALFNNIFLIRNSEDDLYLSNGIIDIMSSGLVKWHSDDQNNLDITGYSAMKDYIEELYPREFILLMQELVTEYILKTDIEKNGRYKLNIYGLNPNDKYTLVVGNYRGETFAEQIITDGFLVKNTCIESPNTICCTDPRGKYDLISIENYNQRNIIINGASFAIEQSSLGRFQVANLYTMTKDIERLKLLADYATRSYTSYSAEPITSEAPYVFSLKK